MRTTLYLIRCISPLCLSIAFPLLVAGACHGQTTSPRIEYTTNTQVDYTGSLLGYYRMEPTEVTAVLPPTRQIYLVRDAYACLWHPRHQAG